MFSFDHKVRVRYAEVDKMGFVYYGNYARFYEVGRAEMLRSLGVTYKQMEDEENILMPVLYMETRYLASAYYDEYITIRTILKSMPTKMITFEHEIFNEAGKVINKGVVKLFFVDAQTGRRRSCPSYLTQKLTHYFEV